MLYRPGCKRWGSREAGELTAPRQGYPLPPMSAIARLTRVARASRTHAAVFLLALAFHAALFGALTLVVNWRTESEAPAWPSSGARCRRHRSKSAPPPPPPPPPKVEPEQREADIAPKIEPKKLEEQRSSRSKKLEDHKRLEDQKRLEEQKRLAEQKKLEEQKKLAEQKKLEEQKKLAEQKEQKRLDAQREAVRKAEHERMLAQSDAAPGGSPTGVAGGAGRRDAGDADLLKACIRPHLAFVVPEGTSPEVYAQFRIEVLPSYELAGVKLVKPSGLAGYDAAAERAIRRCASHPAST